jgi:hypothetical protein
MDLQRAGIGVPFEAQLCSHKSNVVSPYFRKQYRDKSQADIEAGIVSKRAKKNGRKLNNGKRGSQAREANTPQAKPRRRKAA